jgi:hypothetical protein
MDTTDLRKNRILFRRLAISAFILLIGSCQALAQFEVVTLAKPFYSREFSGQVKDPTGGEIEGAHIDLVDLQTQQVIASATTDQKGDFHFERFGKSSCRLKISKPGFNILLVTIRIRKNAPAMAVFTLPIAA